MPPTTLNTEASISEANNNESLPSFQKATINFDEIKTLTTQNGGKKRPRIFSDAEFDRRLSNLREHMKNEGIAACLFTSYHNIVYFSNFLYVSMGRPYGLVITKDKNITVSSYVDYGHPWRTCTGENIVYTDWRKDNYFQAVKEAIGDLKSYSEYPTFKLGIEHDHMSIQISQKLQNLYKDEGVLTDVSEACMRMRMVKSEEEIAVIRQSARAADMAGFAIRDALKEGIMEYELTQIGVQTMIKEMARTYGSAIDIRDTWCWLQSGVNTDGAHNSPTTRKIKSGDILSMNCFPMVHGYYSALERTLFLGHCSEEHRRIWEINVEVHKKGLEIVKPGKRCSDIAKELNKIYEKHDLLKYRTIGYGHSIGVISTYYGREAALELREDVHTILEPGMLITMEPMLVIPEGMPGAGGYREHDILLIHQDGSVENITKFPLGPEHNIIGNYP